MAVDNATMRLSDERGGIVKWLLTLVILGVVLFDAGAIVFNIFSVDSDADDIAIEVSKLAEFDAVSNQVALKAEAKRLAEEKDAKLIKFAVGTDGIIRLTLKRKADTLVVGRIDAISDWARATGEGTATTK
ncbi:MAG: hypothetical protein QOH26_703 [Actinomycetota bacterium]|jgi:hypothetical protein|nr:hypothetical protein [Actinomycetota bacterium]